MSEPVPDRSTVETLRADFKVRLAAAGTDAAVKSLADEFLSRKSGTVTGLMKTLGTLAPDARREFGALVNTLKQDIENAVEERRQSLASSRPPAGAVDVTLPARVRPVGHTHPLMQVRQQVEDIFTHMGYEILEGPEVEDDFHNFEALNMPPDHPARDMQDTLYLGSAIAGGTWGAHRGRVPEAQVRAATLLRTHTSAMQIRYMKTFPPPVRIIVPGRVYRRDNLDLTHTPMFQQYDGGFERHVRDDAHGALRRRDDPAAAELLPLHRAERRGGHQLPQVRRHGLRDLQADRLAGNPR
jgi:phenylalanyl-tRNA synthetase alpha chain